MECSNCSCEMKKMALIAPPGGKVKVIKEVKHNKYEKFSDKNIAAYVCEKCGHIELLLEKTDENSN